jgi:hypothetical protein
LNGTNRSINNQGTNEMTFLLNFTGKFLPGITSESAFDICDLNQIRRVLAGISSGRTSWIVDADSCAKNNLFQ